MISVSSTVAEKKISAVASELKYISSDTFLQGLGLKSEAAEALSFLKSRFPKGDGVSSQNEFGMPLAEGFYAKSFVSGNRVGIMFGHVLERNARAKTVLNSLDDGSRGHYRVFDEVMHFVAGKRSKLSFGWVSLPANKPIYFRARPGAEFTSKTEEFLVTVILPRIKQKFVNKVASRMKRI